MPQGKLLTFHSNMLSLLDASSERYTSHNDVWLTIFGNVHSKIRHYWYDPGLNDEGFTKVKPLENTVKLLFPFSFSVSGPRKPFNCTCYQNLVNN